MQIVADYQDQCGECPVWDPAAATLYWTDCVGRRFYRFCPESGKHEILNEGLGSNGFRLNEGGRFVITNNSGIWLWDGAQITRLIADRVDGDRCQMNDCIADSVGRLLSGSWFFGGPLYHVAAGVAGLC